MTRPKPIVLGITGASGAAYAVRLVDVLLQAGRTILLSISPAGATVLEHELHRRVNLDDFRLDDLLPTSERHVGEVCYYHHRDLMAPMASGSAPSAGMVICPCSGGTLSSIAHAASGNLIQRAADVHLKERRPLILVPRETPLSIPQLDNMLRVAQAGATVLPAMPGFYHAPETIDDLVDFVVGRICDQLGVEQELIRRWGSHEPTE